MTITEELQLIFNQWKQEILDQIENVVPGDASVIIARKVNDYRIEDLIALMDAELLAHTSNTSAHQLTPESLGGMSADEFTRLRKGRYKHLGIPFSRVPATTVVVSGDVITLPSVEIIYLSEVLTLPSSDVAITTDGIHYVMLSVSGDYGNRSMTYVVDPVGQESLSSMVVGVAQRSAGVVTYTPREVRRLGQYAVEETPRGMSIPVAAGPVLDAGEIADTWFAIS